MEYRFVFGRVGRPMARWKKKVVKIDAYIQEYRRNHHPGYPIHDLSEVNIAFCAPRSKGVVKHGVFATQPPLSTGLVLITVFPTTPEWLIGHLLVHELAHAYSVPIQDGYDRLQPYLNRQEEQWAFEVADAWLEKEYGATYWQLWGFWQGGLGPERYKEYMERVEMAEGKT